MYLPPLKLKYRLKIDGWFEDDFIPFRMGPDFRGYAFIFLGGYSENHLSWLIAMAIVIPPSRVVPPPNGLFIAYTWRLLTTYKSWDDSPKFLRMETLKLLERSGLT